MSKEIGWDGNHSHLNLADLHTREKYMHEAWIKVGYSISTTKVLPE